MVRSLINFLVLKKEDKIIKSFSIIYNVLSRFREYISLALEELLSTADEKYSHWNQCNKQT